MGYYSLTKKHYVSISLLTCTKSQRSSSNNNFYFWGNRSHITLTMIAKTAIF